MFIDYTPFPYSGTIQIVDEYIKYFGKTENTFYGLTRGASSTTAAAYKSAGNIGISSVDYYAQTMSALDISAGTFTVKGASEKTVTISWPAETLSTVINSINSANAGVTASLSPDGRIKLVGSAGTVVTVTNGTSDFASKLNFGKGIVSSTKLSELGITSGTFSLNGIPFTYSSSDTVNQVINSINQNSNVNLKARLTTDGFVEIYSPDGSSWHSTSELHTTSLVSAVTDKSDDNSSITVASTDGFPSVGIIRIGSEDIAYTGKTSTTFTGLTRGYNITIAASHSSGAPITDEPNWAISDSTGNLASVFGFGRSSETLQNVLNQATALTSLTLLDLYDNQISDISALANLTNLNELNLASNQISDISALADLTGLSMLNLENNPLNSDALKIIEQLEERGTDVSYTQSCFEQILYEEPPHDDMIRSGSLNIIRDNFSDEGFSVGIELDLMGSRFYGVDFRGANLQRADLTYAILNDVKLHYADLKSANLYRATIENSNLYNVNLNEADLRGAWLKNAQLERANLQGADLQGSMFENANLKGANLIGAKLQNATFKFDDNSSNTNLKGADLSSANLTGADLYDARLQGAVLEGAVLKCAMLNHINLDNAKLTGANLQGAEIKWATLNGADFEGANFSGADLEQTRLIGTNLEGAKLNGTNLDGANFLKANLEGADLRNTIITQNDGECSIRFEGANLKEANLEGVDFEDACLRNTNLSGANLKGAYLQGTDLSGADLSGANLEDADLTGIHFSNDTFSRFGGADFTNANLANVKFSGTELRGVNFNGVHFERANLESANLDNADLQGANLRHADLENATLRGADLTDADLMGAKLMFVDLSDANLKGANLRGAELDDANFSYADLSDADLKDATFEKDCFSLEAEGEGMTLEDCENHNGTIEASFYGADLTGANLEGVEFGNIDFEGAKLRGISLSSTFLKSKNLMEILKEEKIEDINIQLEGLNCPHANLSDHPLMGANFKGTNLTDANLQGANLKRAQFEYAILYDVSFQVADLTDADFTNADFTNAESSSDTITADCGTPSDLDPDSFYDYDIDQDSLYIDFSGAILENANFQQAFLGEISGDEDNNSKKVSFFDADLTQADFMGANLTGATFTEANLTQADFMGANLTGANFTEANLTQADFTEEAILKDAVGTGADFTGADFIVVDFDGADLTNANFTGADFQKVEFDGADLTNANFTGADFLGVDFDGTDLTNPNFTGANFNGDLNLGSANIQGANFENANFFYYTIDQDKDGINNDDDDCPFTYDTENDCKQVTPIDSDIELLSLPSASVDFSYMHHPANLEKANFQGAILSYSSQEGDVYSAKFPFANLANAVFTDADLEKAEFEKAILTDADFMGANLESAEFTGAYLMSADFTDATLTNTHLNDADFTGADFTGADFTDADLTNSSFTGADFTGADFTGADLTNSSFTGADFTGADFTGAYLSNSSFTGADFTGANFASVTVEGEPVNSDLRDADFTGADFTGANFASVTVEGQPVNSDLQGADLKRADLTGAVLDGVDFSTTPKSNFSGTNFQRADILETTFPPDFSYSDFSDVEPPTFSFTCYKDNSDFASQVSGQRKPSYLIQAHNNRQDVDKLLAEAEKGLNNIKGILEEMKELAIAAATDTVNEDNRDEFNGDFSYLKSQITDIANNTQYNGMNLLNGTYQNKAGGFEPEPVSLANTQNRTGSYDQDIAVNSTASGDHQRGHWRIQIGTDNDVQNQHEFSIMNATNVGLALDDGNNNDDDANLLTVDNARAANTKLNEAIDEVQAELSYLGSERETIFDSLGTSDAAPLNVGICRTETIQLHGYFSTDRVILDVSDPTSSDPTYSIVLDTCMDGPEYCEYKVYLLDQRDDKRIEYDFHLRQKLDDSPNSNSHRDIWPASSKTDENKIHTFKAMSPTEYGFLNISFDSLVDDFSQSHSLFDNVSFFKNGQIHSQSVVVLDRKSLDGELMTELKLPAGDYIVKFNEGKAYQDQYYKDSSSSRIDDENDATPIDIQGGFTTTIEFILHKDDEDFNDSLF